ncbi:MULTISPECIES: orotidine-5'-phosphate decarboxylase [Corynebacterium]|jgi:orotidine 5'-phosphate decarboxylase|uniref:orotidine-5'-phosphate decarboxylase n=1 Tax=Corynebacterium TaxID=1716 RepID=UPI0003B861B6|nr:MULTISPECIES: orotidine-5'-phosphate decarboxylase [Corynebacterium]ERS38431.1 orotidine 5'-phosphate decarboxylase [Corynebacterium sp. KPL1995]ERS71771.1 orotidine 5'-phosphate decarboxylase [Corynebacterium sp. KPL1989]MDC7068420.1 orotidine-5'-phosphate decarboxylase [Corynebacterium pseudodiphtheriticum]MDC7084486.1 orotidine-5'-phosphate decarboxylase [Corynebacterium pseudodiphtheriticum]MDC7086263.1 orotidine-5'-phosphate decarboxylase [Corynebacterium pseudodiphtheriticum]
MATSTRDNSVSFGERLRERAAERGRLCVGIDPHAGLLQDWGLANDIAGLREFSRRCVDAFADTACVVKPQVAFYERFGAAGYAVLEETLDALRDAGALVIADAKRGDIGSTMEGYAFAWLDPDSPLHADAVTVAPYLGLGALKPAIAAAEQNGAGVFVLAATSNPEAVELQSFQQAGVSLAQHVVDYCRDFNQNRNAAVLGVVVGATVSSPLDLGGFNGPILMPGVGAQGGTVADIARITADATEWSFPNVSRSVLSAGPDVSDLRKAVLKEANNFPGR